MKAHLLWSGFGLASEVAIASLIGVYARDLRVSLQAVQSNRRAAQHEQCETQQPVPMTDRGPRAVEAEHPEHELRQVISRQNDRQLLQEAGKKHDGNPEPA